MLQRNLPSCSPRALAAARILCAGDEAELAGRTTDALGRWKDPISPINEVREQTRQEYKQAECASVSNIRGASALVTPHEVTISGSTLQGCKSASLSSTCILSMLCRSELCA